MSKALTYLLVIYIAVTTPIFLHRLMSVQAHQNDALETVICSIEAHELHPKPPLKPPTNKQRHQIIEFWAGELQIAHLAPCNPGG